MLDTTTPVGEVDGICLVSGGLDSLGGVIDLLEAPRQLRLSCRHISEGGQISTAQDTLLTELCAHYGEQGLLAKPLFLCPAPPPQSRAAAGGACRFSPSLTPPAPTDLGFSGVAAIPLGLSQERFNPYPVGDLAIDLLSRDARAIRKGFYPCLGSRTARSARVVLPVLAIAR